MILIAGILVASLIFYFVYHQLASKETAKAEIYYYSELVETVELGNGVDRTFSIPQDPHVIFHLYSDGSIRFEQSDCPDQVCVHTGRVSVVGEYAACLPNGIILKIVPVGEYQEESPDIVIGD